MEDPLRWSSSFAVPLFPPFKITAIEKEKAKCPLGHPNLNMVKLTLEHSISFLWTFNLYLHNPFLMFLAPVVSQPKSNEQELMFYSAYAGWPARCVSIFLLKPFFLIIASSLGCNNISWFFFFFGFLIHQEDGWSMNSLLLPCCWSSGHRLPSQLATNRPQSQRWKDLF